MPLCILYTVWLTHILDWLLSSDSTMSCSAFHADNTGKYEKAATLASLCSPKAKKKPHCFSVAVLLARPCCVHRIGTWSLFTALMTGFKHTFLKSEWSDREIFSICNSFTGCCICWSYTWRSPADPSQRLMHTGDMLVENETWETLVWQEDHPEGQWGPEGCPLLPGVEALSCSTVGTEAVPHTTAKRASP